MAASQTEARERVTLRRAVTPAMLLAGLALWALNQAVPRRTA
jgi:hypothetical protein